MGSNQNSCREKGQGNQQFGEDFILLSEPLLKVLKNKSNARVLLQAIQWNKSRLIIKILALAVLFIEEGVTTYINKYCQKGKPEGNGAMFFKNGSLYIGNFENGKFNGHGFYGTAEGEYFEGQFHFNVAADEKGMYGFADLEYVGGYKNSRFEGNGKQKCDDYSFQGSYVSGKRVKGTFTWYDEDGMNKYEGAFDDSEMFDGFATLEEPTGTYKGYFKKGKKHGKGEYQYKTGVLYIGDYLNGKKQGYGKLYNCDRTPSYEGQFLYDVPFGEGSMYTSTGEKVSSVYYSGVDTRFISKKDKKKLMKNNEIIEIADDVDSYISEDFIVGES